MSLFGEINGFILGFTVGVLVKEDIGERWNLVSYKSDYNLKLYSEILCICA